MFHVVYKLLWVLLMLLLVPIFVTRVLPYADAELPALLVPVEDCQILCFMGIIPGQTSLPEAMRLLRENDWVDAINVHDYRIDVRARSAEGWVGWSWNLELSNEIDISRPGQLHYSEALGHTVVEGLYIPTRYRAALLGQGFGSPDFGGSGIDGDQRLSYLVVYDQGQENLQVKVKTTLACPASLLDYWYSPAEIILTTARLSLPYVPPDAAVQKC